MVSTEEDSDSAEEKQDLLPATQEHIASISKRNEKVDFGEQAEATTNEQELEAEAEKEDDDDEGQEEGTGGDKEEEEEETEEAGKADEREESDGIEDHAKSTNKGYKERERGDKEENSFGKETESESKLEGRRFVAENDSEGTAHDDTPVDTNEGEDPTFHQQENQHQQSIAILFKDCAEWWCHIMLHAKDELLFDQLDPLLEQIGAIPSRGRLATRFQALAFWQDVLQSTRPDGDFQKLRDKLKRLHSEFLEPDANLWPSTSPSSDCPSKDNERTKPLKELKMFTRDYDEILLLLQVHEQLSEFQRLLKWSSKSNNDLERIVDVYKQEITRVFEEAKQSVPKELISFVLEDLYQNGKGDSNNHFLTQQLQTHIQDVLDKDSSAYSYLSLQTRIQTLLQSWCQRVLTTPRLVRLGYTEELQRVDGTIAFPRMDLNRPDKKRRASDASPKVVYKDDEELEDNSLDDESRNKEDSDWDPKEDGESETSENLIKKPIASSFGDSDDENIPLAGLRSNRSNKPKQTQTSASIFEDSEDDEASLSKTITQSKQRATIANLGDSADDDEASGGDDFIVFENESRNKATKYKRPFPSDLKRDQRTKATASEKPLVDSDGIGCIISEADESVTKSSKKRKFQPYTFDDEQEQQTKNDTRRQRQRRDSRPAPSLRWPADSEDENPDYPSTQFHNKEQPLSPFRMNNVVKRTRVQDDSQQPLSPFRLNNAVKRTPVHSGEQQPLSPFRMSNASKSTRVHNDEVRLLLPFRMNNALKRTQVHKRRQPLSPFRDDTAINLHRVSDASGSLEGRRHRKGRPRRLSLPLPSPLSSPSRKRKFTDDEEQAIIEGVRLYGEGKWSQIKAFASSRLADRTTVQIKDKWRTIQSQGKA